MTFEDLGGKTRLTLRTELLHSTPEATERYLSGQRAGWSQSLVRFGELLNRAEEQPAPPNEMVLSRVFDAPIEAVWQALTDKDRVKEWYFEIPDFAATPGHEFGFSVEHGTFILGQGLGGYLGR